MGEGDRGISPTTRKINLSPMSPLLFCHENVGFVIFMQFLAILPKMSPPQNEPCEIKKTIKK